MIYVTSHEQHTFLSPKTRAAQNTFTKIITLWTGPRCIIQTALVTGPCRTNPRPACFTPTAANLPYQDHTTEGVTTHPDPRLVTMLSTIHLRPTALPRQQSWKERQHKYNNTYCTIMGERGKYRVVTVSGVPRNYVRWGGRFNKFS